MDTKSAWLSKINWTQVVAFVAMLLTIFGINVPDEVKVQILAVLTGVTTVATWVMRTFFTTKLVT